MNADKAVYSGNEDGHYALLVISLQKISDLVLSIRLLRTDENVELRRQNSE